MKESNNLYRYTACGLNIVSELACPELCPCSGNGSDFDVRISVGLVSDRLIAAVYNDGFSQIKPGAYLLKLDNIAKLFVVDGREIIIDPVPGCSQDLIRLYLFSQGFGVLLHQRGRLILHASAIGTELGTLVFLGPSGAGKSTLAAGLVQAGYRLMADDFCAIGLSPDRDPQVFPAFTGIRLWNDTLEKLGCDRQTMQRVWHKEDKYTQFLPDKLASHQSKLRAIYLLEPAEVPTVSVTSLTKVEQFEALMRNVFRMEYVKGLGVGSRVFRQISQVLGYSKVKRLLRPQNHFCLDQVIECLEEDIVS